MSIQRFLAVTEVLGDREVAVIAATRGVKRDQNDLVPSGISLDNFRRNPIILWQHSPDQPVGCATAIGIVGDELRARIEFAPAGCSALADQLCSLVKAGIVRSISVGFDAKETQPIDPKRAVRAKFCERARRSRRGGNRARGPGCAVCVIAARTGGGAATRAGEDAAAVRRRNSQSCRSCFCAFKSA
jgi:hypothetical protein